MLNFNDKDANVIKIKYCKFFLESKKKFFALIY